MQKHAFYGIISSSSKSPDTFVEKTKLYSISIPIISVLTEIYESVKFFQESGQSSHQIDG